MAAKALPRPRTPESVFAWEGLDRGGKPMRGEMRAAAEPVVRATLRRQGIMVNRIQRQRRRRGGKVRDRDITLFTRQLATMLRAGVPLLQSFDIVSKGSANVAVQRLFGDLRSDVETGTSLSDAFRKRPLHFDALYCNLVAAGEQAGILDDLLDRLAAYKEKMQAIRSKVKSALFYPAAVIVVAVVVVTVIMIFVVPAFKQVFENFGAQLPTPTLIVIAVSDFFVKWSYVVFGAMIAGGYATAQLWRRSRKARILFDRAILRLPVLGVVLTKATIARWLRTLSTMFAAGVPLVEALDSVGGAAGNHVYLAATRKIQQDVATGVSLSAAMQTVHVFPNMVLQMTAIGEESGSLDMMLGKAADVFEREVDDAVASLSSLIEPILMAILGIVIGGMVVAMYLPIFKLGQVV